MAVTVTIASVDRTAYVAHEGFRLTKEDAVEQCEFVLVQRETGLTAYRPSLGQAVRVHDGSTLLFGGTLERIDEVAGDGLDRGGLRIACLAMGYHALASRVIVSATHAAGTTTLEVAASLFAILATHFGTTYPGPTSGGPTLPLVVWDHITVAEALDQLARLSGYVWRINGDKVCSMHAPGTPTGPAFTASTIRRVFRWQQTNTPQVTRVWVRLGTAGLGATAWTQQWTGDGSRTMFLLDVDPDVAPTVVYEDGSPIDVPSATWTYDATRRALVRSSALGAGVVLSVTVTATYPIYVRQEDEAAVTGGDVREVILGYPDVLEVAQGVTLAAAHLADRDDPPRQITLETLAVDVYPWMACSVTVGSRGISGTYIVRRTEHTPLRPKASTLTMVARVELWAGAGPTWREWWAQRTGSSAGTAATGGGVTIYASGVSHVWALERARGLVTDAWVPAPNYLDWIAPSADPITVRIERRTDHVGTSVQVRILDVTTSAVAVTGATSTSTTWSEETLTWSPVPYHRYRLQVRGGNTSAAVYAVGRH